MPDGMHVHAVCRRREVSKSCMHSPCLKLIIVLSCMISITFAISAPKYFSRNVAKAKPNETEEDCSEVLQSIASTGATNRKTRTREAKVSMIAILHTHAR